MLPSPVGIQQGSIVAAHIARPRFVLASGEGRTTYVACPGATAGTCLADHEALCCPAMDVFA